MSHPSKITHDRLQFLPNLPPLNWLNCYIKRLIKIRGISRVRLPTHWQQDISSLKLKAAISSRINHTWSHPNPGSPTATVGFEPLLFTLSLSDVRDWYVMSGNNRSIIYHTFLAMVLVTYDPTVCKGGDVS